MRRSLSRGARAAWLGARTAARVPEVVTGGALPRLLAQSPNGYGYGSSAGAAAGGVVPGSRLPGAERRPVTPSSATPTPRPIADDGGTSLATVVAFAVIRQLARLPGTRWRNTCLHRAVAECLVLRSCGAPAVLRIGVARGTPDASARGSPSLQSAATLLAGSASPPGIAVTAHAWVECPGVRCLTASGGEREAYAVLEAPA